MAYRLTPDSYWLAKRLVKVPNYSLPNLLAGRALVPEIIQEAATPAAVAAALLKFLDDAPLRAQLAASFTDINRNLRQHADARAAEAVADLVAQRRGALLVNVPRCSAGSAIESTVAEKRRLRSAANLRLPM